LFDATWQRIGTEDELSKNVTEVTKISSQHLSSNPSRFTQAGIPEKMSRTLTRQTLWLEDRAYSLIGIFDINMSLLYGEGAKTYQRLQEEIIKQ
jgi:hypothetical protein